MFYCDECGKLVGEKISPKTIVTKIRHVTYEYRNRGEGFEIVQQYQVCNDCHESMKEIQPVVVGTKTVTPKLPPKKVFTRD